MKTVKMMTKIYPFQRTARWLSLGFLVAALLLGGWVNTSAQETPEKKEEGSETPTAPKPGELGSMENPMQGDFPELKLVPIPNPIERGKPAEPLSPHHSLLHTMVGHWTAQVRMSPGDGTDPIDSDGYATSELILGGRALKTAFKGEFLDQKFTGLGLDGYDMDRKNHFSIWMDTLTTGPTVISGQCGHDGMDVVTLKGEFLDAESGDTIQLKTVLKLVSASRYTYEEWHTRGEGEPAMAMQIVFSKVN
jgi:hypothetical protein